VQQYPQPIFLSVVQMKLITPYYMKRFGNQTLFSLAWRQEKDGLLENKGLPFSANII
jgi:hypothetical protein